MFIYSVENRWLWQGVLLIFYLIRTKLIRNMSRSSAFVLRRLLAKENLSEAESEARNIPLFYSTLEQRITNNHLIGFVLIFTTLSWQNKPILFINPFRCSILRLPSMKIFLQHFLYFFHLLTLTYLT